MTEKFTSAKKNLDTLAEKKLNVDIELTKLQPIVSEYETNLAAINAKNIDLERELKFTRDKKEELEQKIIFKEKIINNHKDDLEKREKEFKDLREKSSRNLHETEELVKKIETLERQLKEVESSPKILEKIREKMVHKGFLSDKELEQIIDEFE